LNLDVSTLHLALKSALFMVLCSVQTPVYSQEVEVDATPEVERYLRPPRYRTPMENPVPPAELLDDNVLNRVKKVLEVAADGWPKWVTAEVTPVDLETMVRILSDCRIVGNGAYYEGGYRPLSKRFFAGYTWVLPEYSQALIWNEYCTIMRIFPNGSGIPPELAMETFGIPRLDQERNGFRHIVFGNLDLLYDDTGRYLGVVFVFVNPEKAEKRE
jgi:hypothetical protein